MTEKETKYNALNLLIELKQGNSVAFRKIYELYWSDLYQYAYNIIRNKEISKEILQETFLSLWNKRHELQITFSLPAYLFTAVKYQILNHIQSLKVRTDYAASFAAFYQSAADNSNEENIYFADLKKHVESEVSKLPERCRQIFQLSRNEHQSIQSISDLLNLSHKTVENQLTKALKHLRSSLSHLLLLFIAFQCSLQLPEFFQL